MGAGKVAGLARQFSGDSKVISTQPSKGRPLPGHAHSEESHPRTPASRQTSQDTPGSGRGRGAGSHHTTPPSHHTTPGSRRQGGGGGGRVEMTETATSPAGSYHTPGQRRQPVLKEIEVDYPIEKPAPKQKTKIVYDLGSPQMNTQGILASIPQTTDKYTYTITSVLSSSAGTGQQPNTADSPLSSPTSGSKRPITSYKVIQPSQNPKIGKVTSYQPAPDL